MILRPPSFTFLPYTTFFLFFFNDTATTEIYTLSLHDALPISTIQNTLVNIYFITASNFATVTFIHNIDRKSTRLNSSHQIISYAVFCLKKEEHTSELQSPDHLVCRLLLEKKKPNTSTAKRNSA